VRTLEYVEGVPALIVPDNAKALIADPDRYEPRATARAVEILHGGKRVAAHVRSAVRYGYTTEPAHLPAAHRAHLEWTPERLIRWGASHGVACALALALAKTDVLVFDDLALQPLEPYGREDLLELIDDRADRRATVITAQLPVEHWHGWIGEETIADAILDRLLHQAHRIALKGESLRRTAARSTTSSERS
jgi:hypothetical protein